MKRIRVVTAVFAVISLGSLAQAGAIDTVLVGDGGNSPDTRYVTPGCGSVSYSYNIGKYEVTAGEYCEFLNAKAKTDDYGLYNERMGDPAVFWGCNIQRSGDSGSYVYSVASDWANRPVNYVSFWDACRFANWLHNGQGSGDTDVGAYALGNYNGPDGSQIERDSGWKWALPSEDEWYKAAFYKGSGIDSGYWDRATRSDDTPSNVLGDPADPGNNATYYNGGSFTIGGSYWRTEVGAHEYSESAYGTFDQCGNVWEMYESVKYQLADMSFRGIRGGGFRAGLGDGVDMSYTLSASHSTYSQVQYEDSEKGFRVVQAIPEPSAVVVLFCGLLSVLGMRRRGA